MKNRKPSAAAHVIILAGPLLALPYSLITLTGGRGVRFICAAWLLAAIWVFLTALSGALWRGIRHHDWSAFSSYALAERNDDRFDWETRTGRYSWRRDYEAGGLFDEENSSGHGPGI